jgi:hypothetical protein
MYCPSCGSALSRQVKYCTRCGAQTNTKETEKAEKRFDEYIDGLFWSSVIGLGAILGGALLASILAEKLHLGRWMVIAYLILSSTAFLIVFGLSLWQTLRLARIMKKADGEALPAARDTDKILPAESSTPSELAPSVAENTTRSLEPIPKEHAAK